MGCSHIAFVLLLATFFSTVTRGSSNRKDECDKKLAEAISKFVSSSVGHSHNVLLHMMGMEDNGRVDVAAVRRLGQMLHLDLIDPGQQRELSILLCHAPSLTFLSRTFGIGFEAMDDFRETYIGKAMLHKKLDVLVTLGDILLEMLRWTKLTRYPATPLQRYDGDEVLEFLSVMEDRLDVPHDVRKLWQAHNIHFPLGLDISLGEVALILTRKHTLTTVAERLELPALELEALSKLNDTLLYQYINNVAATLRLYEVADDYGLLNLDWN